MPELLPWYPDIGDYYVLAGTGSRSLQKQPLPVKREAQARLEVAVGKRHAEHGSRLMIMAGMAEGFDKALALTALKLDIPLWCMIPNRGYGNYYWGPPSNLPVSTNAASHRKPRGSLTGQDQRPLFARIVADAARVTYVVEDVYQTTGLFVNGRHSNFVRNDVMVALASEFLVWNPLSRGTRQCFESITEAGLLYEILSEGLVAA